MQPAQISGKAQNKAITPRVQRQEPPHEAKNCPAPPPQVLPHLPKPAGASACLSTGSWPQVGGGGLPDTRGRVPSGRSVGSHRGHLEGVVRASVVQVVTHTGNKQGKDLDVPGWETEDRQVRHAPPEEGRLAERSRSHRTGAQDPWSPSWKEVLHLSHRGC